MDIKKKIKSFPDSAGIYLIKDKKGRILYVGKASSLRKRVNSYFQKPPTARIQALLSRLEDIDYIQSPSSAQALLLENSLIKRYKPYYNVALKDDKSYPLIKINTKDKYPYLSIIRGKKQKGLTYYGPYTNVKLLKKAVKTLRKIFPFRSCRNIPKEPCLYFHLKLCPGMCTKKIDQRVYRQSLRQLGLFLEGRHQQLLKELRRMMYRAAKDESFEEAASLRDKLCSLNEIIVQTKEHKHQDLTLELQKILKLPSAPNRIEAFDISEVGGQGLSGAMVSFLGGFADKKNYRKFKIKTVRGINDYAMICEVLERR
ncbi:MAG: GIY-YIG nuclease family protein, partial [Omnitrophica bacterium]|nr:GIY-YIG nuclease family protein [Candidatus Omnitrophota bacterium]